MPPCAWSARAGRSPNGNPVMLEYVLEHLEGVIIVTLAVILLVIIVTTARPNRD